MSLEGPRLISLRWPGHCEGCATDLPPGTKAWHTASTRSVTCGDCVEAVPAPASSPPPTVAPTSVPPIDAGVAGASARREHERLCQRRERHARERLGWIGVAHARLTEPQQITAWRTGAQGEEQLGRYLDTHLAKVGTIVLHDRRIPRSKANIDHVVVGPGGVTVIDAKNYKGDVRVIREGGLSTPRVERLRIGGRDRTNLVDGIEGQIEHVQGALSDAGLADVDVRAALCFVKGDGLPLFGTLLVRGIPLVGRRGAVKLAARPGVVSDAQVEIAAATLADRFRAA